MRLGLMGLEGPGWYIGKWPNYKGTEWEKMNAADQCKDVL